MLDGADNGHPIVAAISVLLIDNAIRAIACHYNFVRLHKSLRTAPGLAAGVERRLWTLEEFVERTSN